VMQPLHQERWFQSEIENIIQTTLSALVVKQSWLVNNLIEKMKNHFVPLAILKCLDNIILRDLSIIFYCTILMSMNSKREHLFLRMELMFCNKKIDTIDQLMLSTVDFFLRSTPYNCDHIKILILIIAANNNRLHHCLQSFLSEMTEPIPGISVNTPEHLARTAVKTADDTNSISYNASNIEWRAPSSVFGAKIMTHCYCCKRNTEVIIYSKGKTMIHKCTILIHGGSIEFHSTHTAYYGTAPANTTPTAIITIAWISTAGFAFTYIPTSTSSAAPVHRKNVSHM